MLLPLLFILLCTQFALVRPDEDIRDYNVFRLLKLFIDLLKIDSVVTSKDVNFYYYTRSVSDVQLPPEENNNIDATKTTKIIIHGYLDSHIRPWYHHMTDEFLKNGDFNIIQVDWGRVSQISYLSAAPNTKQVAKYVAAFLLNQNLDPKNLHFVGHSLGAHIASIAANIITNSTGVKPARISGLDPAGPFYRLFLGKKSDRLDPGDADLVDVYHTDGGGLGYYRRLGTFDVYINGGTKIQPECFEYWKHTNSLGAVFEDTYCSHTRSYVRFTEIINNYKYKCRKCTSWARDVLGLCRSNDNYVFGAEDIDQTYSGVCFVSTSKDKIKN